MGVTDWIAEKLGMEKRDYTSDYVGFLSGNAEGDSGTRESAQTAAVETAVGLFSRSFALADVEPFGDLFTPELCALGIRRLLLTGNFVATLDVDRAGNLTVLPASSYDITGAAHPSTWIYSVHVGSPSGESVRRLPSDCVVHVRLNAPAAQRWRGRSPLQSAGISSKLLARIESRMSSEAKTRTGHLLPIPALADDQLAALKNDLSGLDGNVGLVESTSGSFGSGMDGAPKMDWMPRRFGAVIPDSNVTARAAIGADVAAALGLPRALSSSADGTALREGFRQAVNVGVRSYGRLFESEIGRVLETPVTLDFRTIRASDITGNARAFKALKEAGLPEDRALELSGLTG